MVTCDMRLRLKFARPWARGSRRLVIPPPGPLSTVIFVMKRPSLDMLWLFSAFATADLSSFSSGSEANTPANCSSTSASRTDLPRIASATRRSLRGPMRANLRCATAVCGRSATAVMLLHRRLVAGVSLEDARRRELAELVPDHVLGDEHRDVRLAVVHADRVTDHLRHDRRRTRPGLDDLFLSRGVHLLNLGEQMVRDERSLFKRASHTTCPSACGRSCWPCACCGASFCPSSSGPTGWSAGGPTSNALRHRHADGRPGSSRCRGPTDACRDGACGRLCRSLRSRDRG